MGNIEDLKIILRAEVDKAISDLKRASREGKNAEKDWDGISKAFKKNIEHSLSLKNAFSQLSMQVAGGIAIYQLAGKTIQAIGKFASDSVKETTEAAEGHARLEAQLRATGYAAGFTVDELEGMASELQRVTKIEDDEVRSAQSTLLKFTSITGEEFKKATALSLDYAKATGGSASSAAQTLGQALEDPIAGFGKLRKAGVMLSDEEENLARQFVATGEEAKAKAVLLKALEDRVGGVAKAVGGADPAGMKTLRLAIKDVKEEAGQLIAVKIEPWVTALADEVERLRARLASKNENANAILQPIKFGNLIDTGDISGVREAIKNLSGKVSKEIVQAWIDEARKRNPLATSAQAAAIRAAEQELLNMSPLTVTGGGTSGGANNSDKKAAEHIKAVNDEINKNVLAIKLRASALGKEADTQEILNSYVSGYLKLIGDSNGLITEKNSTALALVGTINELKEAITAQQMLATKTAAWNALAQQSTTILEENRSTVDSLYKSIAQLSGADERKLQRDQALAKGNEALAAGNAELAESFFLIVDALDQLERKTVAQQVLATKTAAWNTLAQQSTTILEENRSTVDSLYKSIDQLSGADERKLQRDQALAKGNEALAAGNAELAESYFLIVDALNVLIKKTNEFDSKKFFEELGDQALASAESVIASGLNDAFSSIGEAMASGESSADAFGAAMKNFFTSVLQQTSMLAINAGLRLLVEGGITMLPAAIGLLALGGVSAIAAGAISASGQVRQVDYDQYIIDPVIEAETDLAKMRINLIEDQLEKERELRDENLKKIEQQFDMEFSVLQDLWERGLISTQEYKNQAATLRSNEAAAREAVEAPVKAKEAMIEQIEDARKQKLSVLSIEGKKLQDELNGMSGWQKFWSGRDEQLKAQLNTIDARIKATNAAQSLPEISAAKYGADFITAGPRLLKVGDNPGGRERVRVEPIGTPNRFGPSQEQIIIQISGPVYGVEDLYLKLEKAGEQLLRGGRIKAGVFG